MNLVTSIAQTLSQIDEIETWKQSTPQLSKEERLQCYELAQRLWLERCYANNCLYLHPSVIEELKANDWRPNDIQKQMIWASVIGSIDSATQKHRFKAVKEKLVKKYGWDWYNACDKRAKNAYAAKQWINSRSFEASSPLLGSVLLRQASNEEVTRALRSLPTH